MPRSLPFCKDKTARPTLQFYIEINAPAPKRSEAEGTGFEPARACLRAQGISNPPQWTNYANPPHFLY